MEKPALLKVSGTEESLAEILNKITTSLTPKNCDGTLIKEELMREKIIGYSLNADVYVIKL